MNVGYRVKQKNVSWEGVIAGLGSVSVPSGRGRFVSLSVMRLGDPRDPQGLA